MRRLSTLGLLLCLALAGCGDEEPAQVLSETAQKLGAVKSGDLSVRFVASPKGKGADGDIGFELKGPFSVAEPGALPVADIEYTQIAGPRQGKAKLISTGREAFTEVEGEVYELAPARERELRRAKGELERDGGLGELDIGAWIRDPKVSQGNVVDGADTDKVTSGLDVVAALNDLAALARGVGAGGSGQKLEGESAKQVERAVKSARLELLTGQEDRLLRRLAIDVDFGLEVPDALRSIVGPVAGGRVLFELGIDKANRRVSVAEPAGARPYPG